MAAAIGQIFGIGAKQVLMNNGFWRGLSFMSWFKNNECECNAEVYCIPLTRLQLRHQPHLSLSMENNMDRVRRPPVFMNKNQLDEIFPSCLSSWQARWVFTVWVTDMKTDIRSNIVPVFDCWARFKLSVYHLSPPIKVDPENGSIVLVIFTVGQYKELSYSVASYNVQVVLRLADPPNDSDGEKPETPLPTYLTPLEPIGIVGTNTDENVFTVKYDKQDDPTEKLY